MSTEYKEVNEVTTKVSQNVEHSSILLLFLYLSG